MKRMKVTLSFIVCLFIILGSSATAEEPPYMLVRVDVPPEIELIPLLEMGLDIVDGVKDQYLEAVCHPDELEQIRALGYTTEVLIDDMERFYAERSGTDDMGGYHTWSETVDELFQVHADHPNITSEPFSIGLTIEGREMHVIKISDNPELDEDEGEVFFNALTHAREPIGVEICLELIDRLTDEYGVDPNITDLVDNREIYILPVFNVDGYVYNELTNPQGGGMWRKNRRDNGGGIYGVDLNRNYGFDWGYNNIGSSPNPGSATYRGTGPFSEPETENVRQFCNSHNFAIALNIHSYSNLMMYSWSGPHRGYTPEQDTFVALSTVMIQWNMYPFGTGWEVLYEMNGDANDWMYGEQIEKPRILAWLFEVGSSFWPPASQIPGLVEENMLPCLYLIEQAENYMPPRVTLTPYGTPIQIPANGGSFDYNILLSNCGAVQTVFDVWCDVTLPSGTNFGPVLGPVEVSLPGSFSLNRDRTQNVPDRAPAGPYEYNAYTGIQSDDIIWHIDSFDFEKLPASFGRGSGDWSNAGQPFEIWRNLVNDEPAPECITLLKNHPNPFNPITTITYGLPESGFVSLKVFDLLGREVAKLSDGYRSIGVHRVSWDASNMSSGVYFYVLRVGDYTLGNKCLLIK